MYTNARDETDINYDHYQFSVAQKFDFSTRNLTYKKFKYIFDEVFLDLTWQQRRTLSFKTTILIIVFLWFLRIFIHYVTMYLFCFILGVPVTKYEQSWTRVEIVFASWEVWQDALILLFAMLSNTLVFMCFEFFAITTEMIFLWYPSFWYKVLCWQGLYAFLDPPLTAVFDLFNYVWVSQTTGTWEGEHGDIELTRLYITYEK